MLMCAPSPARDGIVMIVDDNSANLTLLDEMLSERGYSVRSFPCGRLALAAAENEPPDLILLDVNMPEMDGYELCRQIKAIPDLAAIPVIFLSALSGAEDKVKGFEAGGIDYISKPVQFEEVQARVQTHIELRRARRREQDLLERTLGAAVDTLWELVQLTAPALAARSRAVHDIVTWIGRRIELEDAWQYEMAARLCLVGCLTLPDQVFGAAYAEQQLTAEEDRMFRAYPESGARLLARIPRLEAVAEMVGLQQNPWANVPGAEQSRQGAVLLHLALEFDRRMYRGMTPETALAELRLSGKFDPRMLRALERYSPAEQEFEERRLRTRDLGRGMVLEQDVYCNGLLILKEGTILSDTWVERLTNFLRASETADLVRVRVRVPRAGALESQRRSA